MEKAIKRYFPIFLLPTLAAFTIGFIVPFLMGIWLSFCKFTTVTDATFNGVENYVRAFQDTIFRHAFWYTALFAVVSLVVINIIAFLIALALTQKMRGTNIFRTVFFMPNLIGGIVLGYIWQLIFNGILQPTPPPSISTSGTLCRIGHPGVLAADRLYDDHLHRRAPVHPRRCDRGRPDRRRQRP